MKSETDILDDFKQAAGTIIYELLVHYIDEHYQTKAQEES